MDSGPLAKVTEGQRACLRLVLLHMSSKDIGRALGISRHTVDQRLKLAMKAVGAASRIEAARLVLTMEEEHGYQRLIHQSPDIAPNPGEGALPASVHEERRPADRAPSPPSKEARRNERLSRIGWLMAIAAAAAVAFAATFIGLNALSEFTR